MKTSPRPVAIFLMLGLLLAADAAAENYFVDNRSGDDRFDGTQAVARSGGIGPFRTIARALRAATAGDRVILANTGNPYQESVTLQGAENSGLGHRQFELQGNGAVLDGSAPIPPDAWQSVGQGIWRFSPNRKSYQMLFLDGRPAARVRVPPGALAVPELAPLQWCLFDRRIYFRPEQGKIPHEYQLSQAHLPVGITLYDVRRVVIRDLVVQGFQLDGINAPDNVFDVTLSGVTSRGNGRSGISIGGASRVQLESSIVGSNGTAQLRTEGYCRVRVVDGQLLDDTAPPIVKEGGRIEQTQEEARPQ